MVASETSVLDSVDISFAISVAVDENFITLMSACEAVGSASSKSVETSDVAGGP